MEFRQLELSDKDLANSYLRTWEFESSEFTFSNMYIWRKMSHMEICEHEGYLFSKFLSGDKVSFAPPLPHRRDMDIMPGLLFLEEYAEKQGYEFRLRMVNEQVKSFIDACCAGRYMFEENRDYDDYVYNMEDLLTLKGKKYHGKRNHINKFLALNSGYEYTAITPDNKSECAALYDMWLENKNNDVDYTFERIALSEALSNMEALDLVGGAIRIGGVMQAFTVGGRVSDEMAIVHIEKGNENIEGIYPFINQQYVEHELTSYKYINREEDMGLPGLRKSKSSYYPVRMIKKYRGKKVMA